MILECGKNLACNIARLVLRVSRLDYQHQRILLVARTRLMLRYLNDVRCLVKHDVRLRFYVTTSLPEKQMLEAIDSLRCKDGVRYVEYRVARVLPWDLIMFADHENPRALGSKAHKLLVNHAISGGKMVNGVPYRYYHRNTIYENGRLRYTRIFEASEEVRERVVGAEPRLKDCIRVVGDLRADRMLAMVQSRQTIRRDLGFASDETVVLIQSTWKASLMETIGEGIINECKRLQEHGRYRFVLSTHPHHWSGPYSLTHPYGKLLLEQEKYGLSVIRPGDDWAKYMVASDVAVTDHTSLTVTYSLLGKPMLYVVVPGATVVEGYPLWELSQVLPQIQTAGELEKGLVRAVDAFPRAEVARIARRANAYSGEAEDRIRQEIYTLLGITTPGQEENASSRRIQAASACAQVSDGER